MTTMLDARDQYFADNRFGADGGYNDAWVDISVGPLPVGFPNTKGRLEAVKYHDLHHIVTGYRTDWPGEMEISAWELGAGCKHMLAAWVLNLTGIALGGVVWPRRTFAAFLRGRHSDTLYGREYAPLLAMRVDEVRAAIDKSSDSDDKASVGDYVRYGAAMMTGALLGGGGVAIFGVPFLIGSLIYNVVRQPRA